MKTMNTKRNLIQICLLCAALSQALTSHAQLTVTNIAAGAYHSLFIKSDGSLWVMGRNDYGELGDNTTDNGNYQTNRPEQIVPGGVTAIAGGFYHSVFIENGGLWAMGNNVYGQLGKGSSQVNAPELVVGSGVTNVAAGEYFSLFLGSDSLWGMGITRPASWAMPREHTPVMSPK